MALGGGVVRGLAHIGVLAELDEAGIPIDVVAGTSVGAVIGALYAAGMSAAEMEYVARKIRWRHLARPVWPSRGFLTFDPLERTLVRLLGDVTFADLPRVFAAVCTDMRTGRQVVVREGRLAPAVRASASVPALVEPVESGAYLLADGVLVNNTPVSVVRSLGVDYVIGVDILAPDFLRGAGPFGIGVMALEIAFANSGVCQAQSDCTIAPRLGGLTYVLFNELDTFIRHGREAAAAVLPEIRRAIAL
jgi:NTE family protein